MVVNGHVGMRDGRVVGISDGRPHGQRSAKVIAGTDGIVSEFGKDGGAG